MFHFYYIFLIKIELLYHFTLSNPPVSSLQPLPSPNSQTDNLLIFDYYC